MSRDFQPQKPTGFDPEARFHVSTHDKIHGAPSHFNNSSTVKVKKGTKGYSWHVRQRKGTASAPVVPKRYKLVTVKGDYLICTLWAGGDQLFIAKPPKLRMSVTTETLDGIVTAYSVGAFAGTQYQFTRRIATPSTGGAEIQVIVPRYLVGDEIWAIDVGDTGELPPIPGSDDTSLLDLNIDARAWTRKNDQTTP